MPAESPPDWAERFLATLRDCAAFALDPEGRILTWNPGVGEVLGYEAAAFVGLPYAQLFDAEARRVGQPEAELRAARAEGQHHSEGWLLRADGQALWRYGLLCALSDETGEVSGYGCILHDQSDERKRDQELLESEARFRRTFENAAVGIAHVDLAGNWLRVNQRLCDIVGYERRDLEQRNFQSLTHPHDLPLDLDNLSRLGRGETERFETDKRYLHKNGHPVWVHLTTSLERNAVGAPSHFISFVQDIGDRKRAEAALSQLNATLEARVEARTKEVRQLAAQLTLAEQRERRRMAQALHDDLQQDLYALNMQLHKLKQKGRSLSPEAHDAAFASALELTALTIRATRHLTAELIPPSSAKRTLTAAFEWLQTYAKSRYDLEVRLEPRPLSATPPEALRVLLVQAVRELLFNVVKHAGTNQATLGFGDEGEALVVSVQDAGKGSDRQFGQAETGGFGLQSIRERLQLFGGALSVVSAPEQGTLVHLVLPLASYALAERDE